MKVIVWFLLLSWAMWEETFNLASYDLVVPLPSSDQHQLYSKLGTSDLEIFLRPLSFQAWVFRKHFPSALLFPTISKHRAVSYFFRPSSALRIHCSDRHRHRRVVRGAAGETAVFCTSKSHIATCINSHREVQGVQSKWQNLLLT